MLGILSFVVALITQLKLKTPMELKTVKTLHTLNIVTLLLMILTTMLSLFAVVSECYGYFIMMNGLLVEDNSLSILLLVSVMLTLGMLLITLLLSIWQIKMIQKLRFIISQNTVINNGSQETSQTENTIKNSNTQTPFLLTIATSPVLFIIRMLTQTTEHVDQGVNGTWRSYDRVFVPGNIKAIMMLLLVASICLSTYLQKKLKQTSNNSSTITILNIINAFVGLLIIFIEL